MRNAGSRAKSAPTTRAAGLTFAMRRETGGRRARSSIGRDESDQPCRALNASSKFSSATLVKSCPSSRSSRPSCPRDGNPEFHNRIIRRGRDAAVSCQSTSNTSGPSTVASAERPAAPRFLEGGQGAARRAGSPQVVDPLYPVYQAAQRQPLVCGTPPERTVVEVRMKDESPPLRTGITGATTSFPATTPTGSR